MSDINPITLNRFAVLATSGFKSVEEFAEALLDLMNKLGTQALNSGILSEDQSRGLIIALKDTPLACTALANIIKAIPFTEEDQQNAMFLLFKTIDDMISFGSILMINDPTQYGNISVLGAGSKGGKQSTKARNAKADTEWRTGASAIMFELRRKEPWLNYSKLAKKLRDEWKDAKHDLPTSDKQVYLYAKILENRPDDPLPKEDPSSKPVEKKSKKRRK